MTKTELALKSEFNVAPVTPGMMRTFAVSLAREGQAIKVTAGPFANLVGQLEGMDANGRVRVLLELMGGTVRVALPQTLVVPSQ
jgi:transcription antitermination factor NusG